MKYSRAAPDSLALASAAAGGRARWLGDPHRWVPQGWPASRDSDQHSDRESLPLPWTLARELRNQPCANRSRPRSLAARRPGRDRRGQGPAGAPLPSVLFPHEVRALLSFSQVDCASRALIRLRPKRQGKRGPARDAASGG